MRYRSGLANVRVVAGQVFVDSGFLCPRGGHGNVVGALDLHAIANEGSALFVRFAIVAHPALVQDVGDLVIMIFRQQIS